jgi:hypothetical protein
MRSTWVLFLVWGCTTSEVDEAFVEDASSKYIGFLGEGQPALGVKLDPDGHVTITFSPTDEDGWTPTQMCLRGWIKTPLGELTSDCYSQDVQVLENGTFGTWISVTDVIKVQASGSFRDSDSALDFWLQNVGKLPMTICAEADCGDLL